MIVCVHDPFHGPAGATTGSHGHGEHAGLRSHADGCDPAKPAGYVEGWYVEERWRNRGVGKALLAAAEEWAHSHGCREMASGTWIDNEAAQQAHEALGFEVVDRCVHYRKSLSSP